MTDPILTTETEDRLDEAAGLEDERFSVRRLITIGLVTRLLVDTGIQLFFPFLPVVAAGLGSSEIVLGRLVSLRSATGLLAPLFGVLADRRGYRTVMRLGLFLAALGYLAIGASRNLWWVVVGMLLAGLGTFAFVPTIQAYLSARLPYARRARGLGILEYGWALSGMFGLFLVGQLIAVAGWRAPLFLLSGGLFLAWLYYQALPPAQPFPAPSPPTSADQLVPLSTRLRSFFALGENNRSAWSVIITGSLVMFAAMHLYISYGVWLVAEYGLNPAQLGRIAFLVGTADLAASALVSLVSDRLGKRLSVLLGSVSSIVAYTVLPLLNTAVLPAVLGFVATRLAFEFTLVSNLTLLSEQAPAQRGKSLTLGAAGSLLGAALAGFTGPLAYARFGVWGLGPVAAIVMVGALLMVLGRVRES